MCDHVDADLAPEDRAILEFAMKLTKTPGRMSEADVERLRARGFCDASVHDIVQITALFNYYNRLGDGLGIDLEPEFDREPGWKTE